MLAFGTRAFTGWLLSMFIKSFYKTLFIIHYSVPKCFLVLVVKSVEHMNCDLNFKWLQTFFLKMTLHLLFLNFRNSSFGITVVVGAIIVV